MEKAGRVGAAVAEPARQEAGTATRKATARASSTRPTLQTVSRTRGDIPDLPGLACKASGPHGDDKPGLRARPALSGDAGGAV